MQMLWCWRCREEMPMLDEDEYARVSHLYSEGIKATKKYRETWNIPLHEARSEERMRPVREEYERITGMKDCHHNAVMHHRLSTYGPPCRGCGKPLRTPKAKLCGSCMLPVQ